MNLTGFMPWPAFLNSQTNFFILIYFTWLQAQFITKYHPEQKFHQNPICHHRYTPRASIQEFLKQTKAVYKMHNRLHKQATCFCTHTSISSQSYNFSISQQIENYLTFIFLNLRVGCKCALICTCVSVYIYACVLVYTNACVCV